MFKVGSEHNFISGEINQVSCLITDTGTDMGQIELLRNKGIEVITVEPLVTIEQEMYK